MKSSPILHSILAQASIIITTGLLSLGASSAHAAIDIFQFGGQVCKPMNLSTALGGLQWRSEGAINTSDNDLWIVCPIPSSAWATSADTIATVFNKNTYSVDITCLVKTTETASMETVRSIASTQTLPPRYTAYIGAERIFLDIAQSVSISCKLPPGTGISSIVSGMY